MRGNKCLGTSSTLVDNFGEYSDWANSPSFIPGASFQSDNAICNGVKSWEKIIENFFIVKEIGIKKKKKRKIKLLK